MVYALLVKPSHPERDVLLEAAVPEGAECVICKDVVELQTVAFQGRLPREVIIYRLTDLTGRRGEHWGIFERLVGSGCPVRQLDSGIVHDSVPSIAILRDAPGVS